MKRCLLPLAIAAALCPAISLPAQVIQSYSGTVFIPGAGEDATVWTRVRSPGWAPLQAYDASVHLVNAHLPEGIPTTAGMAYQVDALRSYLSSLPGGDKVLVAHSMGGLVARDAHRQNPSRIAAVVTIATPHLGSYAANNRTKFTSYLNATISRLAQTGIPVGVLYGTLISPVIGTTIGAIAGIYGGEQLQRLRDSVERYIGLNASVATDAAVGSGTTVTLSTYAGDANLPRGSVHGSIPVTHFPIRLLASLQDGPRSPAATTFSSLVRSRNILVGALRTCKVAYYVTIVFSPYGRRCSLAKKMLVRMDGQFYRWVTGQYGGHTVPKVFDGIVEASRAQYPGLADASRKLQADGSDHMSILWDIEGHRVTTTVMARLGMVPR